MPDRGEALFDGRRGSLAAELLDVGRDMQRLHGGDRRDAGALAPGQKFPRRLRIGAPRVLVANVRGEEFQKARLRARAGGGDNSGRSSSVRKGRDSDRVHGRMTLFQSMSYPAASSSRANVRL